MPLVLSSHGLGYFLVWNILERVLPHLLLSGLGAEGKVKTYNVWVFPTWNPGSTEKHLLSNIFKNVFYVSAPQIKYAFTVISFHLHCLSVPPFQMADNEEMQIYINPQETSFHLLPFISTDMIKLVPVTLEMNLEQGSKFQLLTFCWPSTVFCKCSDAI